MAAQPKGQAGGLGRGVTLRDGKRDKRKIAMSDSAA